MKVLWSFTFYTRIYTSDYCKLLFSGHQVFVLLDLNSERLITHFARQMLLSAKLELI